ncbi:MAG: hypothetical protein FJX56_11970 [Alphaproteobacteria bacterium]|nr:hypothetical protein [Alphaproteobacteria bacterium]
MQLVEVISGLATDPVHAATCSATMRAWGKVPVAVRSAPGFIVNRVARPYYGEALRLLELGAADAATLDALLVAAGFPTGPFALMDLIGLDINLATTDSVWRGLHFDPRYAPTVLQREMVEAGRLGRKSGQGYYDYAAPLPVARTMPNGPRPTRVLAMGQLGQAVGLMARLAAAGVTIDTAAGPPRLVVGDVMLALSDGRPATLHPGSAAPAVVFDYARDYATVQRLAIAAAAQAPSHAAAAAAGLLQAAGVAVSQVADVPGLVVLRTLAMLAATALSTVETGVASTADVDLATRMGMNFPVGPIAAADALGAGRVLEVLAHLATYDGTGRYRPPALLHSVAAAGGRLGAARAAGNGAGPLPY